MKLLSTTLYSGLITLVKTAAGFISTKVVAMFVGAAGVATIGAFGNFLSIVLTFANGAINDGVVKYTAEHKADASLSQKLYSTSLRISISCSLIIGLLIVLFAKYCALLIFNDVELSSIVRILGFTILFYSLNSLLISILNGRGQIKIYSIVNMLGSIVGLVLTCILVYFWQVYGALLALILSQSVVFFITFLLFVKKAKVSISFFKESFDIVIARKLSQYSLMAIVTALTVPVAQILVRNIVSDNLDLNSAGIWQGMMKISDAYLLIIVTALRTYYLPKLSSLSNNSDIKNEIWNGYKVIMPLVVGSCFVIYFMRFFIIKLLYSDTFIQMEELFVWQLLGDVFKIAAFLLAFLMVAKSLTKIFITTEILFSLSYVLLVYFLVPNYGVKGSTIAFCINYLCYFVFMSIYFKSYLARNKR